MLQRWRWFVAVGVGSVLAAGIACGSSEDAAPGTSDGGDTGDASIDGANPGDSAADSPLKGDAQVDGAAPLWRKISSPSATNLHAASGCPRTGSLGAYCSGRVIALGAGNLAFNISVTGTVTPFTVPGATTNLLSVDLSDNGDMVVGGAQGQLTKFVVTNVDGGGSWVSTDAGATLDLATVHYAHIGSPFKVFAFGNHFGLTDVGGTITTLNGFDLATIVSSDGQQVENAAYAVGSAASGLGIILRTPSANPANTLPDLILANAPKPLRGMYRSSGGASPSACAVGEGGEIYYSSDAAVFNAEASGTTQDLFATFGTELNGLTGGKDIFAVGAAGTILRRSAAGTWSSEVSGTTENLRAGVIVEAGIKLYPVVVGDNGTVLVRLPVNVK